MSPRLGLAASDPFWPPADELLEAAESIRSALGDWPSSGTHWRFCLTPPVPLVDADGRVTAGDAEDLARDVIVLADASLTDDAHRHQIESWLARGAKIVDASGKQTILSADGARYALEGERGDDWLPALAAFTDCGFALQDALCLALAWRGPEGFTGGSAAHWPDELERFPLVTGSPILDRADQRTFPPCPDALGLYPLVPNAEWVERLVALRVRTIQLRVKSTDEAVLREQIARAVAAARAAPEEVRLFINDHWQLAIEAGAYGVHLGQEDLLSADFDAIAASGLRLGLSTHGYYEILLALRFRPSYIACGAVFPTTTKTIATAPQGLARLAAYVRLLEGVVPLVAIGGIDLAALPAVLATGVRSAAVVRAVTESNDLSESVSALLGTFTA
jgi:thiamine-phosphate pyrophosphorylase